MLNNEQLDLIADVIRPLYQSLEQDVIYDIARRIKKTLTYTRTAELMVMEMEKLGYSPAKIRSEAMKVLRADKEFQKVVEENTLEYKKEVKKLIQKIEKEAERAGNTIVAEAGDMAWIDDMRVWESAGKKLTDNSYLAVLQSAFAEQTAMELKNLTRSTGFKAVSGFESLENAYRRELDKAVLKICTGTFSQEKVLRDVIRELSQSGIRTVDYSSGRTMQIDTAAKLALRTGCHQISVKIHDQNIMNTGENLVYVTEHWGARNEGAGIENHEEWQGKVYFIKPGTDYSEEAKRIKQDRIMDIWYSTGYSPDGTHVNNPLGLHGYNCRHLHMVWFEGSSSLPEKNPRPEPQVINGKKYDYYHMTQKCRSMERGIRALKKEMIARERLGLPINEIKARISEKTREYKNFCNTCNIPATTSNLRVDGDVVDITKSSAYQRYKDVRQSAFNHESIVNEGGKGYNRYRKNSNISRNMSDYTEPLQLKHVRNILNDMGIDFGGAKIKIIRNDELKGTGYFGWTNPNMKEVQLYPDAFKSREELVKTLGHERVHMEQLKLFGPAKNHDEALYFERGPVFSEEYWWKEYKKKVNYND